MRERGREVSTRQLKHGKLFDLVQTLGTGALPGKMLPVRIIENNLCLFKVRLGKVKVSLARKGNRIRPCRV